MGQHETAPARANSLSAALALHLICDDGTAFRTCVALCVNDTEMVLETAQPLAVGAAVRITPLFPEITGPFELRGVVMEQGAGPDAEQRSRPNAMGIRLLTASSEVLAVLRARNAHHARSS